MNEGSPRKDANLVQDRRTSSYIETIGVGIFPTTDNANLYGELCRCGWFHKAIFAETPSPLKPTWLAGLWVVLIE